MKKSLGILWFIFCIPAVADVIVVDHLYVSMYDQIPQSYIDLVKTRLVDITGESHSYGYRAGMDLLEAEDSTFAVYVFTGTPPVHAPGNPELRFGSCRWTGYNWTSSTGEATFYTNPDALLGINNTIQHAYIGGNTLHVIGFGWCWDMTWHNGPGGTRDPVYQVRWAGSSAGGPEGDLRWGLDAADQALTGNSVCMDTYLNAVMGYNSYAQNNGIPTTTIFTTGPVDGNSANENGYQREVKHQYIRDFVNSTDDGVLFDYADILVYNNSGEAGIGYWDDGGDIRSYPQAHSDNLEDEISGTHIGREGCIRLAKAMWVLLAMLEGWDPGTPVENDFPETAPELLRIRNTSPNPMNSLVSISFESPFISTLTLEVYDISGRMVFAETLGNSSAGYHVSSWDGRNSGGNNMESGVYFIRLNGEEQHSTAQVLLMR